MGKGEIARNKQFLLFPQCFLLNQITESGFIHTFDTISLFAAELEKSKIGISGKGLRDTFTWVKDIFHSVFHPLHISSPHLDIFAKVTELLAL